MHPEIARQLIAQRNGELMAMAGPGRPAAPRRARPRPGVPYWRISWSQTVTRAGGTSGRTWMIVITARRARLGSSHA
jgi:hypothetical protein